MADSGTRQTQQLGQVDTLLVPPPLDRESLSTVLAEAISARQGRSATDPSFRLYEHIDAEALDRLFEHTQAHDSPEWTLSFTVGDEVVTVNSSGLIVFGDGDAGSS